MIWNGLPLLIFGTGGISKETYNIVKQINNNNNQKVYNFLGFVGEKHEEVGKQVIDSFSVVASDEDIMEYSKEFTIIGIVIPIGNPKIKYNIYSKLSKIKNFVYPNIIHNKAIIDYNFVNLGVGNIFAAGTNLTCNINIGNFNLLNLNSTVGHDTTIGNFNVINPQVSISGNVSIGNRCLLGVGSTVLQQLTIKDDVVVGASALVTKNVEANSTVIGIPARRIK